MVGMIDIHCHHCGNYNLVSPMQTTGQQCGRCGNLMSSFTLIEDRRKEIERNWLASPEGKAWTLKQEKEENHG